MVLVLEQKQRELLKEAGVKVQGPSLFSSCRPGPEWDCGAPGGGVRSWRTGVLCHYQYIALSSHILLCVRVEWCQSQMKATWSVQAGCESEKESNVCFSVIKTEEKVCNLIDAIYLEDTFTSDSSDIYV